MTSKEMAPQYVANGGVPGRTSTLMDPEFQATNPSAQAQLDAYAQADELLTAQSALDSAHAGVWASSLRTSSVTTALSP